ncbi:hypothetical protein EW026_g2997 [Hermanssonia centrifuga]|uniref:Zn(2)-C6 fungal-type domain-containing protein n=1 Tax=Hermanssonia centrifuga TaxID=98765 RepID=A0A4S4KNF0_9APHY|nr:hypothetical protein EW026_g2997 [Hermanssonia centrifuga]
MAPLQFKGEIMDFDLGMEIDHRKRRRNRTTQSCLNCHTSKRKCDRKRPCQRCIQLGLTGLCVYEVDDPALRDDPNIDETTRLRNRIAELESLVRELRAGNPLISLTHQLQSTIDLLRQLPEHATRHNCTILKRITQLSDLMHGGTGDGTPPTPFDTLPTPESELMSPVSTSSHSSLNMHQEWSGISAASTAQYDSYFPVASGDGSIYHKTYHIN